MRRPPLSTWMAHGPTPERRAKGGSDTPARALALPSHYLGPAPQAPSALPSCLGQALGIAQPLSWPGAPAPSARQPRRRSQWSRAADAVEAYTRWLRCFILAALPQPLVAEYRRRSLGPHRRPRRPQSEFGLYDCPRRSRRSWRAEDLGRLRAQPCCIGREPNRVHHVQQYAPMVIALVLRTTQGEHEEQDAAAVGPDRIVLPQHWARTPMFRRSNWPRPQRSIACTP